MFPLKTSENMRLFDAFRGVQKENIDLKWVTKKHYINMLSVPKVNNKDNLLKTRGVKWENWPKMSYC